MTQILEEKMVMRFTGTSKVEREAEGIKVGSPIDIDAKLELYPLGVGEFPLNEPFARANLYLYDNKNADGQAGENCQEWCLGREILPSEEFVAKFPEHGVIFEMHAYTNPLMTPAAYQRIRDGLREGGLEGVECVKDGMGFPEMASALQRAAPDNPHNRSVNRFQVRGYFGTRVQFEEMRKVCEPVVRATLDDIFAYAPKQVRV